jgi:hypothetical protein
MEAFRELTAVLLNLTVLDPSSHVRLSYLEGRHDRAVLGGPQGPTDPLLLTDGRYLRVSISVFIDHDDERGPFLKVRESSLQYQADREGRDWVFRYDYLREPGPDPHPTAHLQVNADLRTVEVLPPGAPLARVHFPTGRISIEAVIRLLIEQFGVQAREPTEVWREVLAETEQAFLGAHTPRSGPSR